MSNSEENSKVTVITDFIEKSELQLSRMESAVIRTEKLADAVTGASGAKHLDITSQQKAQARALMGDDPSAKPVYIIPAKNSEDNGQFIETVGAYIVVEDTPEP